MYNIFKNIYFLIPGKKFIFLLIRPIISPNKKLAGYLKFRGTFQIKISKKHSVLLYNDNSTLLSRIFWLGLDGHEKCSMKAWKGLTKSGEVILDLGANFGLFGLIAKKINPQARVILFEPLSRNCNRIERNFKLNRLSGEIQPEAVSDSNGTITFFDMDSTENTIGSIKKEFVTMHKHSKRLIPIKVPTITLDSFVNENSINSIDLMKIDVEGADYEVLLGAKEVLINHSPDLLIEITDQLSANKIMELFVHLKLAYYYYELDDNRGIILKQSISKDSGSRNYLITKKDPQFINSLFPDLVKSPLKKAGVA